MFSPQVYAEESVAPVTFPSTMTPVSTAPAPVKRAGAPAGLAASASAPVAAPGAVGDGSVPNDQRQVRYWTTMCLPSPWAAAPNDAKPTEIYIYRPDLYQDQEGIERRIGLWLDPSMRSTMKMHLADVFKAPASKPAPAAAVAAGAPAAATPAAGSNAFRNEFDETSPPPSAKVTSNSSNAPSSQPVPAGRSAGTP
jgi:hypothetical protein